MPSALVPLANLTLGSTASTVTFSSISGSYRDLLLVINGSLTAAGNSVYIRYNSDSGANYSYVSAYGDGSSAGTFANSSQSQVWASGGGVGWGQGMITVNVMDYSATDKHKTTLCRSSVAGSGVDMTVARWANTSAITTLLVTLGGSTFAAGSSFALYGVS